jgi:hypothetical protein
MIEKEFYKYTRQELKAILALFKELKIERLEFDQFSKQLTRKLQEENEPPFYWADLYEISLTKHIGLLIYFSGLSDTVAGIAQTKDPQKKLLESLDDIDVLDEYIPEEFREPKYLTGTWYSLTKSIESLSTYGFSLSALVQNFRETRDDKYLFNAMRIDHSISACPTFADRIAIAEMENDRKFFTQLANALKKRPEKRMARYGDLRYMLAALDEVNALESLGIEEVYQLFCVDLNLYPDVGKDPARSLQKFILRWKKERETRNVDFMSSQPPD